MTSTRERQRAAARARLEKEMAERAARARKRRQTQAVVGGGVALLLVVAGTAWLVSSLIGDDSGTDNTAQNASTVQCDWVEIPADQRSPTTKDVGMPNVEQSRVGTQTMTITTNLGPITARIDKSAVPCTAGSFTYLAEKNFFDNSKCHRLVTEGIQVLQCGDPSATGKGWRDTDGTGGPSYRMAEENLPTDKRPPYEAGVIAMANSGQPASTGSQFFIVYGDAQLDPAYTVLGTITSGMDLVKEVAEAGDDGAFAEQAGGGHPKKEVVITDLTMTDA
ncbi:peptidylprolyl isomerase [Micromonospora endophytica]|uniref:Peptidylprolyl isomerase n=1 Tax=Micromonospora endophytica TaxID=515350 RepID=A0A2W2BWU3_9ACTN|nr:peptidylprolyl isomerase [Micromonospora endophytica]PZF84924.1 peptidylprolyl isomerase [Micromonospora endophytica]RIW49805.1 peptidylprolyl isomerase [Micromonospora endophytica]BCJ57278.1 peptidyl-prolyl cis-trans isomerase [Micromonospora endophytica]